MFGRLSVFEILLLLAVVLVLFGAKRLPALGAAPRRAIRNFVRQLRARAPDDPAATPGTGPAPRINSEVTLPAPQAHQVGETRPR